MFSDLDNNKNESFDEIFKLSLPTDYVSVVPIYIVGLAEFLNKSMQEGFKVYVNPQPEVPICIKWEVVPLAGDDGIEGFGKNVSRVAGTIEYVSSLQGLLSSHVLNFDTEQPPYRGFNIVNNIKFTPEGELKAQSLVLDFTEKTIIIN